MPSDDTLEEIEATETTVFVDSPIGPFVVDFAEVEAAYQSILRGRHLPRPDKRSLFEKVVENHVGERFQSNSKYWRGNLGELMKFFSEEHFAKDWVIEEEFRIIKERRHGCVFETMAFPEGHSTSYLRDGIRLMRHKETGAPMVISYSNDDDGDGRLTVMLPKSEDDVVDWLGTPSANSRGGKILQALIDAFFDHGPLKGRFFDIDYNFIVKDKDIGEAIAWDTLVQEELKRNVIDFKNAMPALEQLGLSTSRGIILAGPPGTGKTMIGKWLAAHTDMTSILVSAELVRQRGSIRTVYERARLLAPSLIIVEDIDTAGGLDRRASDHPLLGEFLQCMDGMVKNNGVITVATTNHSSSIDPAIADRPGRFDRVIEVGLPNKVQRRGILIQMLNSLDTDASVIPSFIQSLASRSEGLSGAWVAEIVQYAQILAFSRKEHTITDLDLEDSLSDVLERRGLAYRIDSMGRETPQDISERGGDLLFG
jgi:AAA+ superfamily predicted ATPase